MGSLYTLSNTKIKICTKKKNNIIRSLVKLKKIKSAKKNGLARQYPPTNVYIFLET